MSAQECVVVRCVLTLKFDVIGFIGIQYPTLLLREECRNLYQEILSPSTAVKVKYTVMKNLQNHLMEEEIRMQKAEKDTGNMDETMSKTWSC